MLRSSPTITHIAGIPLRMHWSWLAVLLLVSGILVHLYAAATGSYPVATALAVAAALLLCVSVVLHELGHALMARRYGFSVRSITLFAVGGLAEIDAEQTTAIQELLIAMVGPLVSLLLAALSGLIWLAELPAGLSLLLQHLALTNALMAVFNLLPGYPMDGGRIVHALLWFLSDEDLPSAQIASHAGRACGWLLVLLAICYMLLTTDAFGAIWMGMIGFFLSRNAIIGYRQMVLQRTLHGISVADVMQRAYRGVAPELPLDQFVGRYILGQTDQGFPVLLRPEEDGPQRLLGMISLRNLRRFTFTEWARTYVSDAMTPAYALRTLTPQMTARDAFRTLLESGEEQLPVIDGEALLGILRRRDLIRYIQMRLRQPVMRWR